MPRHEVTRRDILAAATAAGLLAVSKADADAVNDSPADLETRRRDVEHLRCELARDHLHHPPIRQHQTNGDEENLKDAHGRKTYLGNYSKGLKHNDVAEPDPASYESLKSALKSGDPDDFEKIILGVGIPPTPYVDITFTPCEGEPKQPMKAPDEYRRHAERQVTVFKVDGKTRSQSLLVDPQAGLGFDLEGADSHELVMRVPPSFTSKEIIAEIAENYWMALARDVPILEYNAATQNDILLNASADLSKYDEFRGPRNAAGEVTPDLLFRGRTPGDLVGDYVSQFLLRPVPFGAYQFEQKIAFAYPPDKNGDPQDFLTDEMEFVKVQNGENPANDPTPIPNEHYVAFGRDLANFVHIDELFQAYFLASLILGTAPSRGGLGIPHDGGNPYDGYHYNTVTGTHQRRNSTQGGFGTLGEPNTKGMVTEVATRALKAVWYQKWFVHRRLRPEEFAGRIHFHKSGKRTYPFDAGEFKKLDAIVLPTVKKNNGGSWLLPMAFPEGCPIHPAYGAGHATVAGACVTVLKAIFHEELTFYDLGACVYRPSRDGKKPTVLTMKGNGQDYANLAKSLTVGGELNKLASNISLGRNIAGVHWRSDHEESLKLGEAVGIQFLRETVRTYNERASFRVTRFDGTQVVVGNNK